MPINTTTRSRNHHTGSSKDTDRELMVALFGFIGLHELKPVLEPENTIEDTQRKPGRKSVYPAIGLLAALTCARVTGSLSSALALLHADTDLWRRCAEAFQERSGLQLPPVPPTRAQVTHFRDRITGDTDLMAALQYRFRQLAVGQARLQGNLLPGVEPNFAEPVESHAIYGDGTVIAKFSEVREVTDPVTGEVFLLGSRAEKGPARIQRTTSDTSEDLKDTNGLNMVAMHTWTTSGRITLGTGVALGGEVWAALELIESLHQIAGDGIHSVIYDRAITGRHCDYLMGALRIQVIGKAVGAATPRADREDQDPAWARTTDSHLRESVNRRLAEYGLAPGSDAAFIARRQVLADMLRYHDRMPLGLCIYPTSNRNFDLVRSVHHELEPVTHAGQDGVCVHRIALDDGGLFEVGDHPDGDGQLVKVRVLRCQESRPFQRPDRRWGRRSRYLITCPHGDAEYVHTWLPEGVRHTPGSSAGAPAPKDRVGWRLRPLSRADDIAAWYNADGDVDHFESPRPFSDAYSRRNDSESYNEWYQQSLRHHGRAASMDPVAQELDFLLGALLNNSITWTNRR